MEAVDEAKHYAATGELPAGLQQVASSEAAITEKEEVIAAEFAAQEEEVVAHQALDEVLSDRFVG